MLGAFLPQGVTIHVEGDANDYVGKSLCGGTISIAPSRRARFDAASNTIAGNVLGYGATSGEVFVSGRVGERFGVRNSGATLVAEGSGDHALEYMTGGEVLIIGPTGRNIAAGMSGGVAYLLDLDRSLMNAQVVPSLSFTAVEGEGAERVEALLRRHLELTGSAAAAALLEDPAASLARFTRIEPVHYARVARLLDEADAAGAPREDAELWRQILEVSNG